MVCFSLFPRAQQLAVVRPYLVTSQRRKGQVSYLRSICVGSVLRRHLNKICGITLNMLNRQRWDILEIYISRWVHRHWELWLGRVDLVGVENIGVDLILISSFICPACNFNLKCMSPHFKAYSYTTTYGIRAQVNDCSYL